MTEYQFDIESLELELKGFAEYFIDKNGKYAFNDLKGTIEKVK